MPVSLQPQHGNINVDAEGFINDRVWLVALKPNRNLNKPLLPMHTPTQRKDNGLEKRT